jgi:hypothetical protein
MKFIFSSFLAGLGTSLYLGFDISERLRDRRLLTRIAEEQSNSNNVDALVYQKVSIILHHN